MPLPLERFGVFVPAEDVFVELHFGAIEILEKGATFSAELITSSVLRFSPVVSPLLPAVTALRVLVAEENVVNRAVVAGILRKGGHILVNATNGREAVEAVIQNPNDRDTGEIGTAGICVGEAGGSDQ